MARPKNIPFSEENASSNYAEFSVSRKPDAFIKLKRLLLLLFYISFASAYCFVALVLTKMAALIAILPLFLFIFWLVTWRLTKIDYTYIVNQGLFHVYRVNGYNVAKEVFVGRINESDGIYPASDSEYTDFATACDNKIDYSAGINTEDRYFARFQVDGKWTAVYFTAASRLLTSLRYFGNEKVIVTYVSH